ncbi:uncharacterized protein LOC113287404 isoform X2 [Papaver somniferum]|uniref:uncharacterized protein LOC113287404 isoform X2 n=1 Tax=Papaver somniferum TaxID=3469 RepID=UPI000E6F92A8|nr:uncharacterized protein LOC113287404 isoform X2 [Papaver somniferum]
MGRARGKGKKLTVVLNNEDPESGAEESIPAYKKRGRPQKPLKDEIDGDEVENIDEEDGEKAKSAILNKEAKVLVAVENGKKRKRNLKENLDAVKEENSIVGTRTGTDNSTKLNGFPQYRNRRKNKPRRAAEAGVECKKLFVISNLIYNSQDSSLVLQRRSSQRERKAKEIKLHMELWKTRK